MRKIYLDANANLSKWHYFEFSYRLIFVKKQDLRKNVNINWFSVLVAKLLSFHMATFEANFIKSLEPSFCGQKEFVYGLKLSRLRRK